MFYDILLLELSVFLSTFTVFYIVIRFKWVLLDFVWFHWVFIKFN